MTTLLTRAIEKQNRVWSQMQEIQVRAESEGRELTAEERASWDAAEKDLTEASDDIERMQRMAALDTVNRAQTVQAGGPGPSEEDPAQRDAAYGKAFGLYLRGGMNSVSPEQQRMLMDSFQQVRALGSGTDTGGGYLVPETFRGTMTETMKAFGGLLNICNVFTTADGSDLSWPTNDDTGNEGALLSENQTVPEQDITIGRRELGAFIFTSKLVKVPWNLLNDSAFPLESWLPKKLGERIGRAVAGYLVTGTGVKQPEGLVTGVATGKTGAGGQTTSIIFDDLIDLEHSVDPAYRNTNCRYLFNDATLKVLRKLKDGDQRPLWVPVPAPGFSPTINGREYTIDNKMPVPAASAKSIVFGDFKAGYVVRQVQAVQTIRLSERYADSLQTGFFGYSRLDGMVDDPAALRAYAHPAS
ncbi:phage major capsid protein [Streptomyces gardneri]|uniref:phage major capsid protein n=1 Tax=Streptomyces gardneri TaxID=66892 RepID=UPI00367CE4CE